jgi:hypothetical protein
MVAGRLIASDRLRSLSEISVKALLTLRSPTVRTSKSLAACF